jgi:hypothetical protein
MDLVLDAIIDDVVVGQAFVEVLHLLEPATSLLRSHVVARVMRNAARSVGCTSRERGLAP